MKNIRGLTLLALMAILLLSSLFVIQVAAPQIIETPINKLIKCLPGQDFVLVHKMAFDEAGADGFFSTTFYWDNNETDPDAEYWNFTYLDKVVKFTDGTSFSGTINVDIKKAVPSGYPAGYYRYTISIWEDYGEAADKQFWVNVTMKNAGLVGGVYYDHASGDQNVTISKVRCNEDTTVEAGPGDALIRSGTHDVSVIAVTRSVPKENLKPTPGTDLDTYGGSSWVVYINVTVKNVGDFTETFSVRAWYGNATGYWPIGAAKPVNNLAAGANTTLFFTWSPGAALVHFDWGPAKKYKTYTIKANATLAGDMNPGNNQVIDGKVAVVFLADVNKDGTVSGGDGALIGGSWYKKPGQPGYLALADINFDAIVSGGDGALIGGNWYKKAPS